MYGRPIFSVVGDLREHAAWPPWIVQGRGRESIRCRPQAGLQR